MAKKNSPKRNKPELDSVYFLKVLLYFVLGLIWVKYNGIVIFPLGLAIGLIFVHTDHFAIDRKVEYAILLISALFGLSGNGLLLAIPALHF